MKSKKSSARGKRNIWKIVSVVFIILFISILAWGILSLRAKPVFTGITEQQITMAEGVVAQDLEARGDSIENYNVSVTNQVVGFVKGHSPMGKHAVWPGHCPGPGGCQPANIQVILKADNSGMLYMVDSETGRVMMRSHTEWFNE